MRPDEHKRKKNAQYKKKHGLSKDSGQSQQQKGGATYSKSKHGVKEESQGHHASHTLTQAHKHKNKSTACQDSETSSSSESGGEETHRQKSYSRRKIVSNWDRYDLPVQDEEEKEQQRGEDFTKLLNSAGDAVSQFRFRDEQDWEEGGNIHPGSEFLAIDVNNLAASLECVPIYERLGLDKNLFSEGQLQKIEETSARYKEFYKRTDTKSLTDARTSCPLGEVAGATEDSAYISNEKLNHENKNVNDLSKLLDSKMKIVHKNETKDSEKLQTCSDFNTGNTGASESILVPEANDIVHTQEDDDDLDFLLSLDKPSDIDKTAHKSSDIGNERLSRDQKDDDVMSTKAEIKSNAVPEKETAKTETDDLEDWLDSVLDD